jgi:hypothetical protein
LVDDLLLELRLFGDWRRAHPDNENTSQIVSALKGVSRQAQTLVREIEGRIPNDNDEAPRATHEAEAHA